MEEIAALDGGRFPGWARTGATFKAAADTAGSANPVCRFYIGPTLGDSHFFSASPIECAATAAAFPSLVLETPAAMYLALPDVATGLCATGQPPIYRLWNRRPGSNHRYTTDRAARDRMAAQGYVVEGYGADPVAMCAAAP
ncbi:MAG: hypothetical protein ABI886_01445 [Betaproteobacteria bacterium]